MGQYAVPAYYRCSSKEFTRKRVESFGGSIPATACRMRGIGARFVYILRSDSDPLRHSVGRATDVDERLEWYNAGPCGYTLRHRPWRLVVSIQFPTELEAARFERYLKSGSGRAFAKRHFAATDMPARGD